MKKLITICLLIAMTFSVNAQDAKPTKEQTIEFIKAYFKDFKERTWEEDNKYWTATDNYKFTILGTNVKLEWDTYGWPSHELDGHILYEFDIKDISLLTFWYGKAFNCSSYITFNTVNKKASIKYFEGSKQSLVYECHISIYRGKNCLEDVSQTQIYKAFDHLRKLCGAPEPIKF